MEAKESFDNFCQQLEMEEECKEKAWNVWESVSSKIVETTKRNLIPWFICAIYVTNCNKMFNSVREPGATMTTFSLSKLLKAGKMRMVEFFQKMKEFSAVWEVGLPVTELALTELKKTFCISAALFHKFQRVMPVVFKDRQDFGDSEEARKTFSKTCWLLFLVCKILPPSITLPPVAPTAGRQTGEKKGLNPAIWAAPVAVVGLIFILILVFFVRKSRRLERSMFALMTRRSMDDEGGVTFHSDEDVPIIQGFSDDEPLVTA